MKSILKTISNFWRSNKLDKEPTEEDQRKKRVREQQIREDEAQESIASYLKKRKEDRQATMSKGLNKRRLYSVKLSTNEQMLFAKRLAFLVGAGVPLLEAMHILRDQTTKHRARLIFERIIEDISNGKFLSSSLANFSRTFGPFTVNIIKTGELSGNLSPNLAYLAEELRKKYILRKKIVGALVYPIIVTLATVSIAGLLTVFIFPKIMPIFTSLNVTLPWTTKALLWISLFLKNYGIYLIIGLILAGIGLALARRLLPPVRFVIDHIILAIPLTGRIALYYNMANYTRTMGLLLKSGVTLTEATATASETMENTVYRKHLHQMTEELKTGKRLSEIMTARPRFFPLTTGHLVGIGEQTGNLSNTFIYLSDMYEGEVDDLTKNLSQAIEPVLMITMGIVVGFVAVSVITPIYEITQSLSR